MEAGIVNITGGPIGYCGANSNNTSLSTGAIRITRTGYCNEGAASNAWWSREFNFDASRSSSLFGNSTTVTPSSMTASFYLKY